MVEAARDRVTSPMEDSLSESESLKMPSRGASRAGETRASFLKSGEARVPSAMAKSLAFPATKLVFSSKNSVADKSDDGSKRGGVGGEPPGVIQPEEIMATVQEQEQKEEELLVHPTTTSTPAAFTSVSRDCLAEDGEQHRPPSLNDTDGNHDNNKDSGAAKNGVVVQAEDDGDPISTGRLSKVERVPEDPKKASPRRDDLKVEESNIDKNRRKADDTGGTRKIKGLSSSNGLARSCSGSSRNHSERAAGSEKHEQEKIKGSRREKGSSHDAPAAGAKVEKSGGRAASSSGSCSFGGSKKDIKAVPSTRDGEVELRVKDSKKIKLLPRNTGKIDEKSRNRGRKLPQIRSSSRSPAESSLLQKQERRPQRRFRVASSSRSCSSSSIVLDCLRKRTERRSRSRRGVPRGLDKNGKNSDPSSRAGGPKKINDIVAEDQRRGAPRRVVPDLKTTSTPYSLFSSAGERKNVNQHAQSRGANDAQIRPKSTEKSGSHREDDCSRKRRNNDENGLGFRSQDVNKNLAEQGSSGTKSSKSRLSGAMDAEGGPKNGKQNSKEHVDAEILTKRGPRPVRPSSGSEAGALQEARPFGGAATRTATRADSPDTQALEDGTRTGVKDQEREKVPCEEDTSSQGVRLSQADKSTKVQPLLPHQY